MPEPRCSVDAGPSHATIEDDSDIGDGGGVQDFTSLYCTAPSAGLLVKERLVPLEDQTAAPADEQGGDLLSLERAELMDEVDLALFNADVEKENTVRERRWCFR